MFVSSAFGWGWCAHIWGLIHVPPDPPSSSGTLRADTTFPAGEVKLADLYAILPTDNPLVALRVPGKNLLDALHNGVSQYPKHEGRFPQVRDMWG